MNYRTKLIFISILIILTLPGCAYQRAYVTPSYMHTVTFGRMRYISLSEFCDYHGFGYSIDEVSHIAKISSNGDIVKIMPDSNISLINGTMKKFSPMAKLKDDIIYIPPSLARYLQKDIFGRSIVPPYIKGITIRKIVIDPGHGGKDPGAIGRRYKVKEKDVVLDISKRLKEELEKADHFEIIITRTKDEFISLKKRARIANNTKADLFISIHANASRSRWLKGFEVYYVSGVSRKLADIIANIAKKNLYVRKRKNVKSARFYVLKETHMPAVLIETGYLSNKEEEWKLRSSSYRKKLAKSIAEGILAYKDKYERTKGFARSTY